jgi:hypothetical protein
VGVLASFSEQMAQLTMLGHRIEHLQQAYLEGEFFRLFLAGLKALQRSHEHQVERQGQSYLEQKSFSSEVLASARLLVHLVEQSVLLLDPLLAQECYNCSMALWNGLLSSSLEAAAHWFQHSLHQPLLLYYFRPPSVSADGLAVLAMLDQLLTPA